MRGRGFEEDLRTNGKRGGHDQTRPGHGHETDRRTVGVWEVNAAVNPYYARVLGEASASALKEFRISPLQYLDWCNDGGKDETPAMHEGTAFHMALHEPERFACQYVEIPNMPLRSKSDREAFLNCIHDTTGVAIADPGCKSDDLRLFVNVEVAKTGAYLLTHESLTTLRGMVESLNRPCHKLPRSVAAQGVKELELRWIDPDSGISCKARIDSWEEESGLLSDLKRTDSISMWAFKRAVYQYEYHYQNAFYRRAIRAAGGDVKYSCFVCGCPKPRVYPWAIYDIPVEVLDECDERISMDLLCLAECLATNNWPTVNNGEPVTLPMTTGHDR